MSTLEIILCAARRVAARCLGTLQITGRPTGGEWLLRKVKHGTGADSFGEQRIGLRVCLFDSLFNDIYLGSPDEQFIWCCVSVFTSQLKKWRRSPPVLSIGC